MDLSIIDEMPKNRIPVVTKIVNEPRMTKVYKFLKDEVSKERQCMIVYPLVKESEKSDLDVLKAKFDAGAIFLVKVKS